MTPRLVLADDHELVRQGLRRLIEERHEWQIVGEASNGSDAVELVLRLRPDVAVIDYSMPGLTGLEATRQILATAPRTQILILTMHRSETLVSELLSAGVRGYVLKSDAGRMLTDGIETLLRGEPYFSPAVSDVLLRDFLGGATPTAPENPLTAREREVVQLVANGKSTKEIAGLLGISVKTAETHRSNVMRKLECRSVSDLVRYAIRNRIIEP